MPITILYGKQDDDSAFASFISSEVFGPVVSVSVELFDSLAVTPNEFGVFETDWSFPISSACVSGIRAAPHSTNKQKTKLIQFFISIDNWNITTMFSLQQLFHNWMQHERSHDFYLQTVNNVGRKCDDSVAIGTLCSCIWSQ